MEQILVEVCAGNDCKGHGALNLLSQVERLYADRDDVRVLDTGCRHYCEDGPVAIINGELMLRATLATVAAAVTAAVAGKATAREPGTASIRQSGQR